MADSLCRLLRPGESALLGWLVVVADSFHSSKNPNLVSHSSSLVSMLKSTPFFTSSSISTSKGGK